MNKLSEKEKEQREEKKRGLYDCLMGKDVGTDASVCGHGEHR